jgi:hypothetical protein
MDEREYVEAKRRAANRLLAIPGVHAVGVGSKIVGGERTPQTSIRVYVTDKRPLDEIPPDERVPTEIDGLPTDVVERPRPVEQQTPGIPVGTEREDTAEYRPVRGGIQVARAAGSGVGTLGCICDVTGDPNTVIALTNYHVIYDPPATDANEEVGQPNGQSSSSDSCDDIVGTVLDAEYDVDVDVALIKLRPGTRYLAEIEGAGVVAGVGGLPGLNDQVTKRGRTTGLTGGIVDDVGTDGDISNPDGTVKRHYEDAIQIQANPDPANPGPTDFTQGGDSGSVYLNAAGRVIALHFAGSPGTGFSWGMPIGAIIDKFTGVQRPSGGPTLPPARHVRLAIASAGAAGDVRTVPGAAMTAGDRPVRQPITPGQARRLEEEMRSVSPRGAWYADLYRRHGEEVAALVHGHRRVTVVWHRSGAAELSQWLVRAFSRHDVRVPEEIQGRPVRACLDDIAAALSRYGSAALTADLANALPTLPDIAGLSDREIVECLKAELV